MADVLDQILQRQTRAQNQQLAAAQRDVDWNATFGRMAPDSVLRETRNMTSLINQAIERKMALAAQTSEEAQRIYINDRKFKAWEQTQPLRDDLLKAQIADETASEAARMATERLTLSRREREARTAQQSADAQWELDQLEESPRPEAEKRAWLNTVRGRYPSMDKAAIDRFESINGRLNPPPAAAIPKDMVPVSVYDKTTGTRYEAPDKAAKAKEAKPDSYDAWEKDLKDELARFESNDKVPAAVWAKFEARKKALQDAAIGAPSTPAATPAPVAAHPMEGQIVRQKSTGKTGRIVNGQFVAQ